MVTTLVARFLISSLAAGTAAPCGSVTVPLKMARVSCPQIRVPCAHNENSAQNMIPLIFISRPPYWTPGQAMTSRACLAQTISECALQEVYMRTCSGSVTEDITEDFRLSPRRSSVLIGGP